LVINQHLYSGRKSAALLKGYVDSYPGEGYAYLHILLSPAIIIDTKGIIPFHDPFGIRNNLKSERRNSNIYPELPYDNAAMPVKQIDAFRPYFTGRLIHDLRIAASSQIQKSVFECRLDGRIIRPDFAGLKLI
jgi:hypothetical protein